MILSVHGLYKSFDGKDILRDASFHVENNEKVAIVGINGRLRRVYITRPRGLVDDGYVDGLFDEDRIVALPADHHVESCGAGACGVDGDDVKAAKLVGNGARGDKIEVSAFRPVPVADLHRGGFAFRKIDLHILRRDAERR